MKKKKDRNFYEQQQFESDLLVYIFGGAWVVVMVLFFLSLHFRWLS